MFSLSQVSNALSSGNLYENMARQLEAFLKGQESRHPKMVKARISNETHVMVGGEHEDNLNLNVEEALAKREKSNSLELADNVVREFKVGVGTPLNGQAENKIVLNTTKQATKRENKSLPTMEIETHHRDGSKHSQRVYANGWTPLVIGSVPGIAPR